MKKSTNPQPPTSNHFFPFGKKAAVTTQASFGSIFPKGKKAFGEVVSTLIMFIAVVSVTMGLVIVFQNYVIDTQDSLNTQNKLTSNKLKTSISIINTYFNSSSNISYYYVKNIGETKLTTKLMNLFVDTGFETNYSIVYADNLSKNISLFYPQETMVIINEKYLAGGSHIVKVITEYGVGDETSSNI